MDYKEQLKELNLSDAYIEKLLQEDDHIIECKIIEIKNREAVMYFD